MVVHAPELLLLISIDVFLVLSLVTCLFDEYFPTSLPYLTQLIALAGFGQLYLSKSFMPIFIGDGRFWSSLFFLMSSMACILATNIYLFLAQKRLDGGIIYMGAVTLPISYFALYIVSVYLNEAPLPMLMFPTLPTSLSLGVLVISTGLFSLGIVISHRPQFIEKATIRLHAKITPFLSSFSNAYKNLAERADDKKARWESKRKVEKASLPITYLFDQEQTLEQDEAISEE
jgi:hypothetical protein